MHHSGVFLKVCLNTSGRVRPCDKITFEKFNRCETIKVKRTVCEHLEGTDRHWSIKDTRWPSWKHDILFYFLNLRANKPSVVYWLILKKVKAALLLYRKGEKVRLHLSVCVRRRPSIPVTCYPSAQFIHSTARSDLAVLGVSLLVRAAVELQAAFVLPFVHATGEWSFK